MNAFGLVARAVLGCQQLSPFYHCSPHGVAHSLMQVHLPRFPTLPSGPTEPMTISEHETLSGQSLVESAQLSLVARVDVPPQVCSSAGCCCLERAPSRLPTWKREEHARSSRRVEEGDDHQAGRSSTCVVACAAGCVRAGGAVARRRASEDAPARERTSVSPWS